MITSSSIPFTATVHNGRKVTYIAVGNVDPDVLCSHNGGGKYPTITSFRSGKKVAGIVLRKADNDCSPYKDGESVPVMEVGETNMYYMLNSGATTRSDHIVTNTGVFAGTIFSMVTPWASIPGFVIGLPYDLNLDKVYRVNFLRWIDKTNFVAKVRVQGLDVKW